VNVNREGQPKRGVPQSSANGPEADNRSNPISKAPLEKPTAPQPAKKLTYPPWNPKCHHRPHRSPPLDQIVSQLNPVHTLISHSSKINYNINSLKKVHATHCIVYTFILKMVACTQFALTLFSSKTYDVFGTEIPVLSNICICSNA
jgi:hypothetical protein